MLKSKRARALLIILTGLLVFVMCTAESCDTTDEASTTTTKQALQVNKQDEIYDKGQPVHMYDHSIPRDLFQQFYDYQTQEGISTYSIITDQYGNVYHEGPTMGYPIPYNTQLTNPEKTERHTGDYNGGNVTLPQAEPNGLYTSPTTNATIVMFIDPETGKLMPVYTELSVTCFPFVVKKQANERDIYTQVGRPTALLTPNVKPSGKK